MNIEIIEYPEKNGGWFITIGNKAPWQNTHIKIPYFFAKFFLKFLKRRKA